MYGDILDFPSGDEYPTYSGDFSPGVPEGYTQPIPSEESLGDPSTWSGTIDVNTGLPIGDASVSGTVGSGIVTSIDGVEVPNQSNNYQDFVANQGIQFFAGGESPFFQGGVLPVGSDQAWNPPTDLNDFFLQSGTFAPFVMSQDSVFQNINQLEDIYQKTGVNQLLTQEGYDLLKKAADGTLPGSNSQNQKQASDIIKKLIPLLKDGKVVGFGLPKELGPAGSPEGSGPSDPGSSFGTTLEDWIPNFYLWAVGIAGSLAILMLIYAGYLYATSTGNPEQSNLAKEYIIGALSGLAFLLLAFIIYNTVKVGGSQTTTPSQTTSAEIPFQGGPYPGQ